MPRFAANLSLMFQELPFAERFAAAAAAGFDAVEVQFPYDHSPDALAGWLRDAGLELVLFNLPPGDMAAGERGLGALPGREADFAAAVTKAMPYAEATGCRLIHAMAGIRPAGLLAEDCDRVFVANLRDAAARLGPLGVTLLVEPVNGRDMPGYHLSRTAHARRIIELVEGDAVRLQFDFYHRQIVEGDLETAFREHLDIVAHVQIAGVPGRNEPDTGEIDYPHLFRLIDALGYQGAVGCEYRPRAGTVEGLGWLKTARAG